MEEEESNDIKKLVKNAQWRQRYIFLFNDIMISTKAKNAGIFSKSSDIDHYSFQRELQLSDYEVIHISKKKDQYFFGLKRVFIYFL